MQYCVESKAESPHNLDFIAVNESGDLVFPNRIYSGIYPVPHLCMRFVSFVTLTVSNDKSENSM